MHNCFFRLILFERVIEWEEYFKVYYFTVLLSHDFGMLQYIPIPDVLTKYGNYLKKIMLSS